MDFPWFFHGFSIQPLGEPLETLRLWAPPRPHLVTARWPPGNADPTGRPHTWRLPTGKTPGAKPEKNRQKLGKKR